MSSNQETAAVSLPNDVTSCHEIIKGLLASLDEKDQRIANLEAAMDALIRERYAPKRERYVDPDQQLLFGEPGEIAEPPEPSDEDNDDSSGKKKRGGGKGRRLLDKNVPCEEQHHNLTDEQKLCPKCDAPLVIVLVNGLLQWAHRPAEIYGIQHVHEKGFCQCCHEHVVVADKPPQMIEKGAADASLLAHLTTSNKGDHLPTYRYEEISLRHGWWLPRSTQVGWLTRTAVTAVILYSWMASRALKGELLGTDATGVRVLEPGTGQAQKGTVWVYCGQREVCPYLVYEYTRGGDGEAPRRFLDGYAGYLQADAASVFDQFYRGGTIFEVACGAHMRRYFYKARHSAPLEAHRALVYFRQLYMLERELAAVSDDERRAMRHEQALPILDEFKAWLDELAPVVVPKTEIAAAVTYALNQWDPFVRYCDQGWLLIDNTRSRASPAPDRRGKEQLALLRKRQRWTNGSHSLFARLLGEGQPGSSLLLPGRRLPPPAEDSRARIALAGTSRRLRTSRTARRHPTAAGTHGQPAGLPPHPQGPFTSVDRTDARRLPAGPGSRRRTQRLATRPLAGRASRGLSRNQPPQTDRRRSRVNHPAWSPARRMACLPALSPRLCRSWNAYGIH